MQFLTLYLTAVFLAAAVVFWFLPGARTLVAPLKLYVIGFHELCHMMAVSHISFTLISCHPLITLGFRKAILSGGRVIRSVTNCPQTATFN